MTGKHDDALCPRCLHPRRQHYGSWCRVPTGAVKVGGQERICCCTAVDRDDTTPGVDVELTAGQLTFEHLNRWVSVHNLHVPGADFNDDTRISVTGRLVGFDWHKAFSEPQVRIHLAGSYTFLGGTFGPRWPLTIHPARPEITTPEGVPS